MSRLDRARDAIDLAPATVDAVRFVEHTIFGEDLADGRAPTCSVVFTEDVVKHRLRFSKVAVLEDTA